MSQQGQSVSIIIRSIGIAFTISQFSSVFIEQPFIPIKRSISQIYCISSKVPVKLCTTPVGNLCLFCLTMSTKSVPVDLEWRYIGKLYFSVRRKWGSKASSWHVLSANSNLSQSRPHSPIATIFPAGAFAMNWSIFSMQLSSNYLRSSASSTVPSTHFLGSRPAYGARARQGCIPIVE